MPALLRPAALLALLLLAGCVAPPPPPGVGAQAYYSAHCAAGFYQCELPAAGPAGQPCACPGLGAPSYGFIR